MNATKRQAGKKALSLKIKSLESKITPNCMPAEECDGGRTLYTSGGGWDGWGYCHGRLAVVADY